MEQKSLINENSMLKDQTKLTKQMIELQECNAFFLQYLFVHFWGLAKSTEPMDCVVRILVETKPCFVFYSKERCY